MQRVKEPNGMWSLFCPNECPGLDTVYGDEFVTMYEKYEASGLARRTFPARELWLAILDTQMETGTPYLLYKDAANSKSNQQNLGVIRSSNLCCEIIEYSDSSETAVCNLASIALPAYVDQATQTFNFNALHDMVKTVTNNLNRIIDVNFYPTLKTQKSNLKHRPIGIGVQGLADTFFLMNIPYCSEQGRELNTNIFETIYHASLEKSCEIARERYEKCRNLPQPPAYLINPYESDAFSYNEPVDSYCGAYSSFISSPLSKGIFQFDMWGIVPSNRYDWSKLRSDIMKYGTRNSLLVAPMPTASTSQILGYNECFEPITSNIFSRRTLAGEFIVVNKYLMHDLIQLGVWSDNVKNSIIANKGSIQHLDVDAHTLAKYKTVWEMSMKHLIDMAVDRGAYICQSQSLNLWMADPNYNKLTSMHFYAWEKGLKTGIYYLRRKAKHQAQQFTIEPTIKCSLSEQGSGEEETETCQMCSA